MTFGVLLLIIVSTFGTGPKKSCSCEPATADDHPHGANEVIQYNAGSMRRIRGKVTLPDGEPVSSGVVEVYKYSGRDKNVPLYQRDDRKRRTACLTNKNGEFCFPGLPAGKYFLKVGTRGNAGMNEVYIIVNLAPNLRSKRRLDISLPPGT